MEEVFVDLRTAVIDAANEDCGLTCGRQTAGGVEVGRQKAVVEGAGLEADLFRAGIAGQQLGALIRAGARSDESTSASAEVVIGLVIGVGPDAPLRIIGEAGL